MYLSLSLSLPLYIYIYMYRNSYVYIHDCYTCIYTSLLQSIIFIYLLLAVLLLREMACVNVHLCACPLRQPYASMQCIMWLMRPMLTRATLIAPVDTYHVLILQIGKLCIIT